MNKGRMRKPDASIYSTWVSTAMIALHAPTTSRVRLQATILVCPLHLPAYRINRLIIMSG